MSHSDFDVVTGPSMAQRRAQVPEHPDTSSDPVTGTGAAPAAQPEPADEKSLARSGGRLVATVRQSQRKPT